MNNSDRTGWLRRPQRIAGFWWGAVLGGILAAAVGDGAMAAEGFQLKAEAPKDQLIVGNKIGGVFYAAKPLKEEYDKLLVKVQVLRKQIANGTVNSREAADEVRALQGELQRVRKDIDDTKAFIAYGKTATKTETQEFALGPEKLLFISGVSKVKFIGWENKEVKCVLEKTVIGDGKESLDEHFEGIRLVHHHGPPEGRAKEEIGRSAEERQDDEEAFLKSPEGQKLTVEKLKARREWIDKAFANAGYFGAFQGKPIDYLELEGLTHQQGNRQVSYEVMSAGGNGQAGSMWQRHATLTIYLPKCNAVGLRGGLGWLEANGLKAALIVRGEGDRDYESHSHVKDHEGVVTIENIALDTVDNIRGNVSVTVSADLGNAGTMHREGGRTQYVELPATYMYRRIEGDLTALLLNVNLQLSDVTGRIDVNNQFGDTRFTTRTPLAAAAHRIVSESGNVTLQLAAKVLDNAPLVAVSECGSVKAADSAPQLIDGNISCWPGNGTVRHTYRGFATQGKQGQLGPFFRLADSFLLPNESWFKVLSRAGTVQIEGVGN